MTKKMAEDDQSERAQVTCASLLPASLGSRL